jgi:hypothetical protein
VPYGELGELAKGRHFVSQHPIRTPGVEWPAVEGAQAPLRDRPPTQSTQDQPGCGTVRVLHLSPLVRLKVRDQPIALTAQRPLHRDPGEIPPIIVSPLRSGYAVWDTAPTPIGGL